MTTSPTPLSGKERSRRVPLDYYKLPVRYWKLGLSALFLVTPLVVWAGFTAFDGAWGTRLSSPGPVHAVHATWANDCNVCHDGPLKLTGGGNVLRAVGIASVSDALCQKCHAGTEHHASIAEHAKLGCADCHFDHRGDVSLVRVADSVCVRCHGNLAAHRSGGADATEYKNEVTSFPKNHPEFSVLSESGKREPIGQARDPGKLKFNHQLHLRPGQKHTDPQTRDWTLKDVEHIDPKLRKRYAADQANQGDDAPVILECKSCHRLDATDVAGGGASRGALGAYMLPVTYENDCRGCHPLTFDKTMPKVQVPHHLQPPAVNDYLWGAFAARDIHDTKNNQKFPLPGKFFRDLDAAQRKEKIKQAEEKVWDDDFFYEGKLNKAKLYIYSGQTTCGLCHEYKRDKGVIVPKAVLPPNVPEVWMPHARFDHRAHRAVDCRECHSGVDDAQYSSVVLLPNKAKCQECHSPAHYEGGQRLGGARFDCVECHRYHGGDVEMHNVGSRKGAPAERRTGAKFRAGS